MYVFFSLTSGFFVKRKALALSNDEYKIFIIWKFLFLLKSPICHIKNIYVYTGFSFYCDDE